MMDTDQKTQDKSAQDKLKNLSEMEEGSEKGKQFLTKHFSENLKLSRVFISMYGVLFFKQYKRNARFFSLKDFLTRGKTAILRGFFGSIH